jgi:hypothetical protein
MKFKIKKMKWLIPALALLIILESILVVKNTPIGKSQVADKLPLPQSTQPQKEAEVSLQGEETASLGETSRMGVVLLAKETLMLDGVDVYINYDPDTVEILGIDPSDKFSYVARNWIEPEEKRILISLVEPSAMEGVEVADGEEVSLAVIEFKPLTAGRTEFEIYSPGEAKGTVLAGQGKEYSFTKENLTIRINK